MVATGIRLLAAITISLVAISPAFAIVTPLSQPAWNELTTEQRKILAPLASEWDALEVYRRKKWIGIAQRYPGLTPEEQLRTQERMKNWIKLSPEQRKSARATYKLLRQAPPEKKVDIHTKWKEYSQLPDAEKKRLQAEATKKANPRPVTGRHPVSSAQLPLTTNDSGAKGVSTKTAAPSVPAAR